MGGEQGLQGYASEIKFRSEHSAGPMLPHCKHLQSENVDKRAGEVESSTERISL